MQSISGITLVRIWLTAANALELPKPVGEMLLQPSALQITDAQRNPFSDCNWIYWYLLRQALVVLSLLQFLMLRKPKS